MVALSTVPASLARSVKPLGEGERPLATPPGKPIFQDKAVLSYRQRPVDHVGLCWNVRGDIRRRFN